MLTPTQRYSIWLKGFLDACGDDIPTEKQVNTIKQTLNGLFEHVVDNPKIENKYNPKLENKYNLKPQKPNTNRTIKC